MDRDKKILIAVVGGAGILGLYFALRSKPAFAAPIGLPMAQPSFLDTLIQGLTDVAVATVSKRTDPAAAANVPVAVTTTTPPIRTGNTSIDAVIARARARGEAHYLAWSAAFRLERSNYVVGNKCFRTSDAAEIAASQCASLQLEGLWERG